MSVFFIFLLQFPLISCIQYVNIPFSVSDFDVSPSLYNISLATFTDDCPFDRIALPFSFPFYDQYVSNVYIAADGYISLKPIVPCYCYFTATNCNLETNRYDAIIAPYLTDLNPLKGNNQTKIRYRIEQNRLIVIWDSVPDYDREHYNSFMAVLYKEGDIVFIYKDIQWPFRSTGFVHDGLIGIRPFITNYNYSTRGLYHTTSNLEWETFITGNYANYEDMYILTSLFCQPRQFIFQYVELFLLTPTEYCVTPSQVHQSDHINITIQYSSFQSHFISSSSLHCLIGNKIITPVLLLTNHSLLCLEPNFTTLLIPSSVTLLVSLEVYSNIKHIWYTIPTIIQSYIQVFNDLDGSTFPFTACGMTTGVCDSCGYCNTNNTASLLQPNQCLGKDHLPYTPNEQDCSNNRMIDDTGVCCNANEMNCLGICDDTYDIGINSYDNSTFCCPALLIDCEGYCNGPAIIDSCGICSGGTTNHIANSDSDCYGTCFGPVVSNCYVQAIASLSIVNFTLSYYSNPSSSVIITIMNVGEYPMILLSQTPEELTIGLAPSLQVEVYYQGEIVDLRNTIIQPNSHIDLNFTADISSIIGSGFIFGHRKSQIVDFLFTPLTRNQTEGTHIPILFQFDTSDCEDVNSITTCSLLPHCFTCIYNLDFSMYSYYFNKPFSLSSYSTLHPSPSIDTSVFSCLHGDSSSTCSTILDDIYKESNRRKYAWSWELFSRYEIWSILLIDLIILMLIIWNIYSIRKERAVIEDMLQ